MHSRQPDEMANPESRHNAQSRSQSPAFAEVVEQRYSRRQILHCTLGAAIAGLFGGSLPRSATAAPSPHPGITPGFAAVSISDSDSVVVPPGYRATAFLSWGTPICGDYPAYREDGSNSGAEQECQVGSHHDGMHFFPLGQGKDANRHGLLCINHEYVDLHKLHPAGASFQNGARNDSDQIRKEVAAHGVSIVEIREQGHGHWTMVRGRYNRRITGGTPMVFGGPVRGSELVQTRYSPEGTDCRGTLSNCAHGVTPWGTYLTCEENWAGCFLNRAAQPREQSRYGVRSNQTYCSWETLTHIDEYVRFDATPRGASATQDYRNEPNTQGWVVEIDPFDPDSTPVKRTALGRFAHEGAVMAPARAGQPLVVYSGDDAANEYIYKFVTQDIYDPAKQQRDLLDRGTLYVAVFHGDGSGEWRALEIKNSSFKAAAQRRGVNFRDQAELLVNTRSAADLVGATPMDRPEWGAVHPDTNEVYFTLTNNVSRGGEDHPVDAANPRARNRFGHIVRWREQHDRSDSLSFEWELFVLAGPEEDSQVLPLQNGSALDEDNRFACPDGLWIDPNGVLWIQTDMNHRQRLAERHRMGNNQMLAANPATGEIRRFLTGPRGQEVAGITATPDGRTLFVNIQHPGEGSEQDPRLTSHWPDGGDQRPRSATLVITRGDGGIIGS